MRQGSGMMSKVALWLGFALSVFCTIVVVKGMFADDTSIFDEINSKIDSSNSNVSKVERDLQALQRQVARSIDILERKSAETQIAITEMAKAKESGIKWIKSDVNGKSYTLTPAPMSWADAQRWAKENGGDLTVINNEKENQWLVKAFGSTTQYWIGLTDDKTEGKFFWVTGAPALYLNWGDGEPDNYKGIQHHVAMNGKVAGKWNDRPGTEQRIAIVEKK